MYIIFSILTTINKIFGKRGLGIWKHDLVHVHEIFMFMMKGRVPQNQKIKQNISKENRNNGDYNKIKPEYI